MHRKLIADRRPDEVGPVRIKSLNNQKLDLPAVDKAESAVDIAHAVNATAPGILAEEAARLGALLVHFSTDYVFNGSGSIPWRENDGCDPLNVYGATKLEGERAIQATDCRHLIFRTSWVYGARGSNFLLTMRRLMRERAELKIVDDQMGAPTWCRDLAEATAQVLSQVSSRYGRLTTGVPLNTHFAGTSTQSPFATNRAEPVYSSASA